MLRDYRNKGVQFFYVYKNLAHPEVNSFVPVASIKERLMHIQSAKEMMKTEMNWICDTMDNAVKKRFGGTYNGEFIIDPEGVLRIKRFWSDPVQLRKDLVEMIGPVEKETKVADLETVFTPSKRNVASGIVPKPIMPPRLMPLQVEPLENENPFFAKLRIEATPELFRGAISRAVITMYLDPIYKVHWNNKMGRVKIRIIDEKEAFKFNKDEFESIEVKEDADIDPRWMVARIQSLDRSHKEFKVEVTYTVCDDDETFCKEVVQQYKVTAERDLNGGTRPGIFLNGLFSDVKGFDQNKDGKIVTSELPVGEVTMYIGHLDYDHDGEISFAEIDRFMSMFNNGNGMDEKNDGG